VGHEALLKFGPNKGNLEHRAENIFTLKIRH
jgi:hypothetical protein